MPPGARGVHAFQVQTYLGRYYWVYAATPETCRERHEAERAAETSRAPERFPFYGTSVRGFCRAMGLTDGGYDWAAETPAAWGVVMPSAELCEAMREVMQRSGSERVTACAPVTLTPR